MRYDSSIGIDAKHPDLAGKVIGWNDLVNHKPAAYDDQGHGTHVSSIIAGTGAASGGQYAGNAPGAALVGVKVLSAQGSGSASTIISGIQWVIDNKARFHIGAANMSLGAMGCSDGTDSLSQAVNNAIDAGIVMVVAAGNSGPDSCSVGAPGAAEKAVTVGASIDPGKDGWALAYFSSRGPTADGRTKPDVISPGWQINAAQANGTGYVAHSGTSMATPGVAGIVALMLDANPALTPDQVKSTLMNTAKPWGLAGLGAPNDDYGAGLVSAYDAVKAAKGVLGRKTYRDGTSHDSFGGTLTWFGADEYTINVTSTTRSIGLTLIMNNWTWGYPDFDLYLIDPSGAQVASSEGSTRQETITFKPTVTGTYTVRVTSYMGDGDYTLDASYR